jgi:hypothetical protein
MRIWTLHPKYLDSKGLVALWREALLARAVLRGDTKGYRNHPQLIRFRNQSEPLAAIESYLAAVHEESLRRGYRFDATKLSPIRPHTTIPETRGQIWFEWAHLLRKLAGRDPDRRKQLQDVKNPDTHPLFHIIEGPVREWEKGR